MFLVSVVRCLHPVMIDSSYPFQRHVVREKEIKEVGSRLSIPKHPMPAHRHVPEFSRQQRMDVEAEEQDLRPQSGWKAVQEEFPGLCQLCTRGRFRGTNVSEVLPPQFRHGVQSHNLTTSDSPLHQLLQQPLAAPIPEHFWIFGGCPAARPSCPQLWHVSQNDTDTFRVGSSTELCIGQIS